MADRRAIRGRICHADDGVKRRDHLSAECVPKTSDDREYAPATLRNRDFIVDVLRDVLTMTGAVVGIASGSGEHVVHFARCFPRLVFHLPILIPMHVSVSPLGHGAQASRMCGRPSP